MQTITPRRYRQLQPEDRVIMARLLQLNHSLRGIATVHRPMFEVVRRLLGLRWSPEQMARHKVLAKATGIAVYFCDPHSPWQRGSNENMNGLVRQYLPKGTDLAGYSQEQLDAIADEINNRPRKGLGVRSPLAVYTELLLNSPQHSTLTH